MTHRCSFIWHRKRALRRDGGCQHKIGESDGEPEKTAKNEINYLPRRVACMPPLTRVSPIAASRQLLLVVAPGWGRTAGHLQRFARASDGDDWQPVGSAMPVSLGRAGLAWGRGLHPDAEPAKREGDGRAPAGVFAITALFGHTDNPLAGAARLPYLVTTPDLKAIDDLASAHYNRVVDQRAVTPDWSSCEDMLRGDERYALGAVVAHNPAPAVSGAGSCIFLHVWESAGAPTAGCTAMALADMTALAGWLDAAAAPVLVQLPQAEYEARRAAWGLPSLPA
jgi:L,D-peptidoglycan transpeptidase YkuD (ErfK/YbiS/YcfS/YnhG family)